MALFGASCSDDTDGRLQDRQVRLSTGIRPPTRAVLDRFNGETVAFAKGVASGRYTEYWQAVATSGETRLLGEHTYPENHAWLYLRGYYPVGKLIDGKVEYRLDGETDLMATVEQKGNLVNNFSLSDKTFYFNHLLTQVSFEIRTSQSETREMRLASLRVAGSRPEAVLPLAQPTAGELPEPQFSGDPEVLTAYVEPERGGGVLLSREVSVLPEPLLVEPGAPLLLEAKVWLSNGTARTYTDLPVHFDEVGGVSRAGTAYRIRLTLHPSDKPGGSGTVEIGAVVTPWIASGTGIGTIQ